MIHKAWCSIEEVPYYFSRSYIKFQGHTGWKIDELDKIWARLLGRSQLSNPSDLPCLGSSIKFQGHTGWKFDDLNPIWLRLLGRSLLSNPSDLPCLRSYMNFQGHKDQKVDDLNPIWVRLLGLSQLSNPSDLPCWIMDNIHYTPRTTKLLGGYTGFTPSVHPSVRPSVRPSVLHAVSALYHLQLWMDSFHIRHKWSLLWEGV